MIKKILLAIASLFLIWQSYSVLAKIDIWPIDSWVTILILAFIINLFITGIFAFAGFAFPTQKLLPESYYSISNPKRLKKVYGSLRVDWFRNVLLATLWKSKQQRKKYFNGKKNGLDNLVLQSKKSEFGHLIPFVFLCFVSVYLISIGKPELGIASQVINVIGNLYPIILQRHHRMRIEILRHRQQKCNI